MDLDYMIWRRPADLLGLVERRSDELGDDFAHNPGRTWREAFVAAHFAIGRAEWVRLLPERHLVPTPDFAIRDSCGRERWIETTEVDRRGRHRGDEYRGGRAPMRTIEHVQDSEWVSPDDYIVEVRQRVHSKCSKDYDRVDALIVWSNAFPIAREHLMTASWWRAATLEAAAKFQEVYVHYRGVFYAVWLGGVGTDIETTEPRGSLDIGEVLGLRS